MEPEGKIERFRITKLTLGIIGSVVPLVLLHLYSLSSDSYLSREAALDPIFFENRNRPKTPENSIFFGKQSLVYFGYLRCKSVCHGTISKFKKILNDSQSESLQIVLISLDPENESSDSWRNYFSDVPQRRIRILKPESSEQSFRLASLFGDRIIRNPITLEIEHLDVMFWVDEEAKIRSLFPNFSQSKMFSPEFKRLISLK
ncbi:SCO1/SenC domain protein [Leptospira fainei serovar Hurstbridge str. BUT 6]|uniref:SCO1/SenC domain protein n=1 Tax=Leptospira fainei serovar Hurstbridge str. BUT 6 TaxID=1193011 RepID=S3W8L7_9LEPT|nr:SCO family protein [Leptospira fainei]EPG76372.1 SCO1/SenC domain protein [Leptospira fainei serovar Hurstbridge str. BUT 6]